MSGIHNENYYSLSLSFLSKPLPKKMYPEIRNEQNISRRIEYIAINFWPITNKIQLMFVNTCRATFIFFFSGEKHINIIEKSKRQGNNGTIVAEKTTPKPPSSTLQQQKIQQNIIQQQKHIGIAH